MKPKKVQDPVCGMRFAPKNAASTQEWDERLYYFCCEVCRRAFEADPDRYVRRSG